ncbi:hypothetical protein ACY2HL_004400 [Enterobacter roggenkampii]
MIRSKYFIAALILTGSSSALAAGTVSNATQAAADLVFNAPLAPVTLTVTPTQNLTAGGFNQSAVLGVAKVTSQVSARYAYRYGPFTSSFTQGTNVMQAVASGTTNPNNKIELGTNSSVIGTITTMNDGSIWYVTNTSQTSADVNLTSRTAQTIAPDTYRISFEAASYAP